MTADSQRIPLGAKVETMTIQLACCTATLLDEIAHKEMKRRDIAKTYALALRSTEKTDWPKVNRAIIKRWSRSGLDWIKKQAWSGKCFEESPSELRVLEEEGK